MATEKDYVLGTHDDEIARLALQHRVWRAHSSDAWRRAGFTVGQTLIDLGCGPGWATLDLAEIVGPTGRVIAIDRSRRFLDTLEATAHTRRLSNIEVIEGDLDEYELPTNTADGIWSRWVYAFVKQPRRLLERAARALRPGGRMVLHEYVDYRAWRVSPPQPEFAAFVEEVIASWRENGGEPDIGMLLPLWLAEQGLEIRSLDSISEVARPGDYLWQWPLAFVDVGLRRLVDIGRVSEERARAMAAAFAAAGSTPGGFTLTPTVIEIIAIKR